MYRWASEPGGGEGFRYAVKGTLAFTSCEWLDEPPATLMSPARKWRICERDRFWGVGASGSTIARTNVCSATELSLNDTKNWGSFAVWFAVNSIPGVT